MKEQNPVRCFASYSKHDSGFVEPIVSLMRTVGASIFYDRTDIAPGDDWSTVITDGLNESQIVFVFWSINSSQSDYVRKEVQIALDNKKKIIPVLLDNAKLWDKIARFQWVDFRQRTPDLKLEKLPKRAASLLRFTLIFLGLFAIIGFLITLTQGDSLGSSPLLLILGGLWIIWKLVRFIIYRHRNHDKKGPIYEKSLSEFARELDSKARKIALTQQD